MRKLPKTSVYLDYLHKGFVCICLAATIYGGSYLSWRGYRYWTQVRPQIKSLEDAENRKLLAEGASEDIAPILKV